MTARAYALLYVADPMKSAEFYGRLLGRAPFEAHPTFVSFEINDGLLLGLWSTSSADISAPTPVGGSEVGLVVATRADVDRRFQEWKSAGATILKEPADMVFGRTFLAADPDGHRLRVFNESDAG
ncbi:VOC family protein [Ciceribacter azotifigens]|uniref:VOC family protein n=1 Tax=Ciceribacter azotifigens TaxID=2069303 RepID=UPI003A8B7B6F